MNEALRLDGVTRTYPGARPVVVLKGVDLAILPGEIVALVAPSGAGKSTLLQVAGLLDTPTSGSVRIGDEEMTGLDEEARTAARRTQLGFVYQFHHLLPEFTAEENVALPLMTAGVGRRAAIARGRELLARVGLSERTGHRPAELSGGEQQRTAICRALANDPRLLLADEPTGNLDVETSGRVFDMLLSLVRETGLAALIATHNTELARQMDRIVRLDDGRIAVDT
ncbi:MAG: ABC transporter ATP-binding protein [Pseudomonadota bacterium]